MIIKFKNFSLKISLHILNFAKLQIMFSYLYKIAFNFLLCNNKLYFGAGCEQN